MPRYYFHLTDRNQWLNNHEGIDLSGNAAARDEAMTLARDLKQGTICGAGIGTAGSLSSSTSTDTRSTIHDHDATDKPYLGR